MHIKAFTDERQDSVVFCKINFCARDNAMSFCLVCKRFDCVDAVTCKPVSSLDDDPSISECASNAFLSCYPTYIYLSIYLYISAYHVPSVTTGVDLWDALEDVLDVPRSPPDGMRVIIYIDDEDDDEVAPPKIKKKRKRRPMRRNTKRTAEASLEILHILDISDDDESSKQDDAFVDILGM
jgi:hypothetical protein